MNTLHHPRPPRWPRHLLLLALSSFVIPHSSFAAESPLYIPFQGQVTNQAGNVSADGQYSVIFNLYDQAVGGQPIWSERHVKIGVTKGMINVFLGSITPLTAVDFSQTKYLGITVDVDNLATTADPEMVPRSLIMPAFHAKKAENATKLAGQDWSVFFVNGTGDATNDPTTGFLSGAKIRPASITAAQLDASSVQTGQIQDAAVNSAKIADGTITSADLSTALQQASIVPPGSIMPFGGPPANVPAGWKYCDGSALKGSDFPSLFATIGTSWGNGTTSPAGALFPFSAGVTNFNLPDLRGQFLRGVSGAMPTDPEKGSRGPAATGGNAGNNVGSIQTDEFKSHSHVLSGTNWMRGSVAGSGVFNDGQSQAKLYTNDPPTSAAGGTETRPKNVYVNYIIKL